MTNNSIFTRVLALIICVIMLAGTLTACLQEVDLNNQAGSLPSDNGIAVYPQKPAVTTPSTGDNAGNNDPIEDPNELFSASTELAEDSLIFGTCKCTFNRWSRAWRDASRRR